MCNLYSYVQPPNIGNDVFLDVDWVVDAMDANGEAALSLGQRGGVKDLERIKQHI